MKRILLSFILVSCATLLLAQPYRLDVLATEQGLSSNFVTSMATDKTGRLWVATEEGLNRLQGRTFHTYYKGQGPQLTITGNELNCLLDDPKEPVMWIGTQRDGLCAYHYDTGRSEQFRHRADDPASLATNEITHLERAADGGLWVCTYWAGVEWLDPQSRQFSHWNTATVSGMGSDQTWCCAEDGDRRHLYVGHVGQGLSIIDLKTRKARHLTHRDGDPHSLASNEVLALYVDGQDRVWVGTNKGLDLYDPATDTFRHIDDGGRLHTRVFDIREMNGGELWLATELRGVARLELGADGTPLAIHYLAGGDTLLSLPVGSIRCMTEDAFGNAWVGTYGGGVCFLTRHMPLFSRMDYQPTDPQHSLSMNSVLAVMEDEGGGLWIGTDGAGIDYFLPDGRREQLLAQGLSVQAIVQDREGRVWAGAFNDGIYCAPSPLTPLHKVAGSEGMDVRSFYEDAEGRLWVCTSQGLYVTAPQASATLERQPTTNQLTRSIVIDRQQRRWVGTFGGGLEVYTPQMDSLTTFKTDSGFPSNTINQLIADAEGRIWAATAEGLVVFDGGMDYRVYAWESGLSNLHIKAVAEDGQGNIWVSTNKGISCLRRDADQFLNYSHRDHLPAGNFSIACTAQRNGQLFFGSTAGLCRFRPALLLEYRTAPQFYLAEARLHTQRGDSLLATNDGRLTLRHNENSLSITLGVLDYAQTDETEFAYRLHSGSEQWIVLDADVAALHNLEAGTYELEVRSRLRNEQWGSAVRLLELRVLPPWWLSWWAYLIYIIGIGALGYYLYVSYRNHIHLRNLQEQWARLSQGADQPTSADTSPADDEARAAREQKRQQLQASLGELDQQFLSRINRLIEERIASDKIDIGYLADGVCVSQSTLYRKMKSLTGISSNEYVRRYKMHYAERLLLEGRYSVSEVAYMVGMQTPGYFRKCFKEEFGKTPSDYVKDLK